MPIFIKENQELQDNMYEIPDKLEKHLKQTLSKYKDYTQNKGYKRLNALVNPEYNKHSDKADRFKDGKHITFTDMKRIDHDFRHMNKNPKNMDRILNGGEEMAHFVKDTLNKERTKVAPVLKQKKVETRNKNELKPTLKPMKPIKLGNVDVNVHEGKKIYIKENHLEVLKEYRNQLTIPFDGIEGKYNYEHFIDYLEAIGKYGKLNATKYPDLDKIIEKKLSKGIDYYENFLETDASIYTFEDFISKCSDNELENMFDIDEYEYFIEMEDYSSLMDYLNEYGEKRWYDFFAESFKEKMGYFGFPNNIIQDNRGLILVERSITIPQALSKNFKNYQDYYQYLMDNYSGVGTYWSWNCGKAYCGNNYDNKESITLRGYVDPISVNWVETIAKQVYYYNEEMEIKVYDSEPIEIFEIITKDEKHFPLKNPIIVNA